MYYIVKPGYSNKYFYYYFNCIKIYNHVKKDKS